MSHLGDKEMISISYKDLVETVSIGSLIYLDNGHLELKVVGKSSRTNQITCEVLNDFRLGEYASVYLPRVKLDLPSISDTDEQNLKMAAKYGVDFVAISGVRSANCVQRCRNILQQSGGDNVKIISKIQNHESLENLEEIIKLSDGIILKRKELSVELQPELQFGIQKYVTQKAKQFRTPLIVRCRMIGSSDSGKLNRSELTDVGNLVFNKTDAMLFNVGLVNPSKVYPIERTLKTILKVCNQSEAIYNYYKSFKNIQLDFNTEDHSLALSAVKMSFDIQSSVIICLSKDPGIVQYITFLKPKAYVIYPHSDLKILRSIQLYFGIIPIYVPEDQLSNKQKTIAFIKKQMEDMEINDLSESTILLDSNENSLEIIQF